MAQGVPKMTVTTQIVLGAFLADPQCPMYGVELHEATGLPTGTIYPILSRFNDLGWLSSTWEDVEPRQRGRPQRHYHQLTEYGTEQARKALATAPTQIGRVAFRPPDQAPTTEEGHGNGTG